MAPRTSKPLISPLIRRFLGQVKQRPETANTVQYMAPVPIRSSHSLAMPGDTQETTLKSLCGLTGIPFDQVSHHLHVQSETTEQTTTPLQALADFGTLLARGSEARLSPWALLLLNHQNKHQLDKIVQLSDALRQQRLPIELRHLVEDARRCLPDLDPGTVLRVTTVQLPRMGCCLPKAKKLTMPVPVQSALSALDETTMSDLCARILLELQKEYPLFATHNAVFAICLMVVMLVCYETLRDATDAHATAKRDQAIRRKQTHETLMAHSQHSQQSLSLHVAESKAASQVTLTQDVQCGEQQATETLKAVSVVSLVPETVMAVTAGALQHSLGKDKAGSTETLADADKDDGMHEITVFLSREAVPETLKHKHEHDEATLAAQDPIDASSRTPSVKTLKTDPSTVGLQYSPSPVPVLAPFSITDSLVNMQATLSAGSPSPRTSSTFSGPLGRANSTSAMQALKQASTVGRVVGGTLPEQLFDHDVTSSLWK